MPFKSKAQMRACYAKKSRGQAGSWDCAEWSHHTSNTKALPEHVKKTKKAEELLTKEAAFKAGFLLRCAEEGLSAEQIDIRAKEANEYLVKNAEGEGILGAVKGLGTLGGGLLFGAPPLLGALGGYLAGSARNASQSNAVEQLKMENKLSLYQKLLDDAKKKAKLRKLQAENPGELVQIS